MGSVVNVLGAQLYLWSVVVSILLFALFVRRVMGVRLSLTRAVLAALLAVLAGPALLALLLPVPQAADTTTMVLRGTGVGVRAGAGDVRTGCAGDAAPGRVAARSGHGVAVARWAAPPHPSLPAGAADRGAARSGPVPARPRTCRGPHTGGTAGARPGAAPCLRGRWCHLRQAGPTALHPARPAAGGVRRRALPAPGRCAAATVAGGGRDAHRRARWPTRGDLRRDRREPTGRSVDRAGARSPGTGWYGGGGEGPAPRHHQPGRR